jgi:DNA (cytosine-5)-methyltransferase 1
MKHIDLFSGIGGFSLACEWAGIETICFVEIDKFCQKVLKKHWPDVPVVEDVNDVEEIKRIVAHAVSIHDERAGFRTAVAVARMPGSYMGRPFATGERWQETNSLLLTAGFPCQPFSAAGRRKGSADSRYLWPQTLAVIEAVKPDWVLLENVAGILSMVFPDSEVGVASQASFCDTPNDEIADYDTISGRIDGDLRQAGYETVWLVIPACAVNAPHRRDRVWIIAHSIGNLGQSRLPPQEQRGMADKNQQIIGNSTGDRCTRGRQSIEVEEGLQQGPEYDGQLARGLEGPYSDVANSTSEGLERYRRQRGLREGRQEKQVSGNWNESWYEVATKFCRVDDGIPRVVDRVERLKALGNAIVPQVAYQVIKAIVETESVLSL